MPRKQQHKRHKWLKAILITTGSLIGIPVVLVVGLLVALTIPSFQQRAARMAARILSDKMGIEASVGHFSVKAPFDVLLEDVFAGGGQGDTLVFAGRLDARLRIDALPDSIAVRHLGVEDLAAHTGDLIPAVKMDGRIGRLSAGVRSFGLKEGRFSLTDVRIKDAELALELTEKQEDEDSDSDSAGMVFDLEDVTLENVRFSLEPQGLKLDIGKAETSALVDLDKSCYTVRGLDVADADFSVGSFGIFASSFAGDAIVDLENSLITSDRLEVDVPGMKAEAELHGTRLDLETMRVTTVAEGSYAGAVFSLDADYDIDDEAFRADLDLARTDVARVFPMPGKEIIVAGKLSAAGSLKTGTVRGTLSAPVHYADSSISAGLKIDSCSFAVSNLLGKFPGIELDARLADIDARIPGDTLEISGADVRLKTREALCDAGITMPGAALSANLPAHLLAIPSLLPSFSGRSKTLAGLDSLLAEIPPINADVDISRDNPFRGMLQKRGVDLTRLVAGLRSEGSARKLDVSLATPDLNGEYRLPAMDAALAADLAGSRMDASLKLNSEMKDGLLSLRGVDSGIDLEAALVRNGDDLRLDGDLKLADLVYDGKKIGDRNVVFNLVPDPDDPQHFVARANLDDVPVGLVEQFATIPEDIALQGDIRARAVVTGIPEKAELFAGVKPVDVGVTYKPYDIHMSLDGREVTLENDRICLNGLSIIGADSTSVAFDGGMDLGTRMLDISVKSDAFEPVKLPEGGVFPVYGKLVAGIDGSITGPVDSLLASIDVNVLPQSDLTYPIDKKNLAQLSPSGTVNVSYGLKDSLRLGGRLDVDKGKLFYSPKLYPMMPFSIDSGSHLKFNGGIKDTELAVSASQGAKATYKPRGEASRMVDFITGVKVGGSLDKLDIGFYLDAPKDREIQDELAAMPEEDREGLAAVLLATGMYVSESNEATQLEGYALTSIVQSKLNAAMSNKLGNVVDIDFGVAKAKHGRGIETTDYNVNVSKSFFDGRLNVKLGGSVSDNAEVNKNSVSFLNNLSAEYALDSAGVFKARLFSMKDYNNIVEGELIKSGAGILIDKTIDFQRDSLDRSLDIDFEGNVVYRSNNQLGPDAAVSFTKNNLFGQGDVFTAKLKGAYYWNLGRKPSDPTRNDTFLFGADFSLNFPYMQLGDWAKRYIGQTTYKLGYLNENISGDYGIHKLYGGVDYSIRSSRYVTHSFSPLYLSVVLADRASEDLARDIGFVDMLKLFVNNEFIPSMRYSFNYNNYSDRGRTVNTALDIQLKESANIISGVLAACGQDFNQRYKQILGIDYDQFVKYQFELRNKFRLGEKLELATRLMAGAVITFGNSVGAPLSESFSIGGPNSLRAFAPRSIGPGDFYNRNYSSYIFHAGDMKLEANAELRFPIVWKLNGAVFVDAGNVWNQRELTEFMSASDIDAFMKGFGLTHMYNSSLRADTFLRQIALGSGFGVRLDYESIVIRLDLGVAIHAPYDTGRAGYYNIPSFWKDGLRLNFGIGYPF
ncbi:MAG: translocation/assembly module TamB domain-containing protein [Bacteroidia bacterium]|nr:translocation/assembly module TamB domain-containing protein [Bacteroidia bacterium]